MRFALPGDWKVFDAEAISSGKDKALTQELEKTFSMNADQLAQVFGQLDLMVVGPPEQEFAPNVNVVANGFVTVTVSHITEKGADAVTSTVLKTIAAA